MSSEYSKKTVAKLKELLKKRKLDTSGVKKDLIERLEEDDQRLADELDEKSESEVEDEPKPKKSNSKVAKKTPKKKKPATPEPSEDEAEETSTSEEAPKVVKKTIPKKKKPVTPESSLDEAEDEGEQSEQSEEEELSESEAEEEQDEAPDSEEISEVESSEEKPAPKKTKSAGKPTKKPTPPEKPTKKTKTSKKDEEGIFGSLSRVDEVLCRERSSLDIFRPHTEKGSLSKLIEKIFRAPSTEKTKTLLSEYISPVEECLPRGIVEKRFQVWLSQIVDDLIESLTLPTGDVEPKFDSSLGIYRIGSYAFQMDPKTMSTALVFAYISNGKIVPLSAKTLKECPKEYTLWHEHHSDRSPPNEKEIRKIVGTTPFPREKDVDVIDVVEDGISFPRKPKSAPEEVEKDLATITIPKPDRKTFQAYRKSQQRLKTTNYVSIAKDAGIDQDDARYIAQHFNEMSVRYAK